jgi:hypothetical protein
LTSVYIVISCDVDPDRERLLDGITPGTLAWKGATEGIPAVKDLVRGLRDGAGREPVFTWVLRADEQIRQLQGSYAWFVRAHQPLLRQLLESGDELGWHPHFWRRDAQGGAWSQEIEDLNWQLDMIREAHRDLTGCFPADLKIVRMGWSYHNNRTYAALDELGMVADLSAVPGLRTLTGKPPARRENLFDWHCTPRSPFRPSRADYRRPPRPGESACRMLEVPSFVSTSLRWSLVSGAQMARKTGDSAQLWYALRRPTYCVNFTTRPAFFAPLVAQLRLELRRAEAGPLVFATQLHADELVPNRSGLYSLKSVRANLEALLNTCRESGVPVEFVPASRIPELWPNQA